MADDPVNNPRAALEQVNSVTLPKIYREIGRRVAKSPKVPAALKHHFDSLARLKPAADAQDAATVAQLREAYAALGRDAVALYGEKAIPKDVAPLLADALEKQKEYSKAGVNQPDPRKQSQKRRTPFLAYAVLATAFAATAIGVVVFWRQSDRRVSGGKAPIESSARNTSQSPVPERSTSVRANAKESEASGRSRTASTTAPEGPKLAAPKFDTLVVPFSAQDAERLKSLGSSDAGSSARASGQNQDKQIAEMADRVIAATRAAVARLASLGTPEAVTNAMGSVVEDWSRATSPLMAPLEDEPAIVGVLQAGNKRLLKPRLEEASQAIEERRQRTLTGTRECLANAQEYAELAFGGVDDIGRPFRRPEADRQQMLEAATSQFAASLERLTKDMAQCRASELRGVLSASQQQIKRGGERAGMLLTDILQAENRWKSRVRGVQESLVRLINDGESFAPAESKSDFRKMAQEQQAKLEAVVASESRELAAFWSSIAAEMVAVISEAKDMEDLEKRQSQLSSRLEARREVARARLDKAHDEVTEVFAKRMEEAKRRQVAASSPREAFDSGGVSAARGPDDPQEISTEGSVIPRQFFTQRIVKGLTMDQVHGLLGPPDDMSDSTARVIWNYFRVKDESTGKGWAFVSFDRQTGLVAGVGSTPNDHPRSLYRGRGR